MKSVVWTWFFVDKLDAQNNEVKFLSVAVDICQSSNNENKVYHRHLTNFQNPPEIFRLIKKQNMGNFKRNGGSTL